jgi:hypothetical protein
MQKNVLRAAALGAALAFAQVAFAGTDYLTIQSGDGQTATVGTALPKPLAVRVHDKTGGLQGVKVTFTVTAGGGSLSAGSATTDQYGFAQTSLTLGKTAGQNSVKASAVGLSVTFTETATAAQATQLVMTAGNNQSGTVGSALAAPCVVTAQDKLGNPVSGVSVGFSSSAGSVSPATVTTGANGQAQATLTLGNTPGAETVTATAGSLSATFSETALAGPVAQLVVTSGNNQSGTVGSALAAPCVVTAQDKLGNAVSGVSVGFSSSAGSVSPATAVTGTNGQAQATLTLGNTPGTETVTATAGSLSATFSETALVGPLAQLVVTSGNNQSGTVGSALAAPCVVTAQDRLGNAVSGVSVSFSSSAGSVAPATAVTGTNGQAQATLTLGTVPGTETVTATAGSLSVTLSETAQAATASQLLLVSGSGQSGQQGMALAAPLVVFAADAWGNAVSGATITFSAPVGGGSVSPATATTNAQGQAQATLTLGLAAGTNTFQASGAGQSVSVNAVGADFFVATNGQDTWSGHFDQPTSSGKDGPFATVAAAQAAVRALNKTGRTNPIVVFVRAGTYYGTALTFAAADSGSATLGIVYQSYPGEAPVLSGGQPLTGWTGPDSHGWYTASAAGLPDFAQLFRDGTWLMRTRTTPTGYLFNAGPYYSTTNGGAKICLFDSSKNEYEYFDRFDFAGTDCSAAWNGPNASDIEILDFEKWTMPRLRLASVDATKKVCYLTGPTKLDLKDHGFISGHRYIVENVPLGLLAASQIVPGNWQLDRTSSTVTYVPSSATENPAAETFVAPVSVHIVSATGLEHVTFRGLTFSHASWTTPQAGYVSQQDEPESPAALSFTGSSFVTIDSCTVSHTGGWGIEIIGTGSYTPAAGPWNNQVTSCTVTDIGAGGIRIGTTLNYAKTQGGPADTDANVAQYNYVHNCMVAGTTRFLPGADLIEIGNAHNNTVDHNEGYDCYNHGLDVGFTFPYDSADAFAHDNVLQFNLVHDVGQGVTSDIGGIYLAVASPAGSAQNCSGNKVLNNVIHDVTHGTLDPNGYGGWGLYFDNESQGITAQNNLVYRCSQACMHFNGNAGPNPHTVSNNILAYGVDGILDRGGTNSVCTFDFTNNVVYFDKGGVQRGDWSLMNGSATAAYFFDKNLYWDPNASVTFFTGGGTTYSFSGWQGLGEDVHSPAPQMPFASPPTYPTDDYTVPAATASLIGFQVFDPTQAGVLAGGPAKPPAATTTFPLQLLDPSKDF